MKIGVLGSGLMGKEVVRDLIYSEYVTDIDLADIDFDRVKNVCDQFQSPKLIVYHVNANDYEQLATFMKRFDVIINALFYSFNETVAKTAITVGVHAVDLGGHIGNITNRVLALKDEAKTAGVTIILYICVSPGMIYILYSTMSYQLCKLYGVI